jgi:hypothetical protein
LDLNKIQVRGCYLILVTKTEERKSVCAMWGSWNTMSFACMNPEVGCGAGARLVWVVYVSGEE